MKIDGLFKKFLLQFSNFIGSFRHQLGAFPESYKVLQFVAKILRIHKKVMEFWSTGVMVLSHQSKTTTRQMLNLCISIMPFTPGPTNLVWKA